jgi:hypothetical protein
LFFQGGEEAGAMKGEWVRRPQNRVAAVFIHGVLSSGESCWKNANGCYWPELLASEEESRKFGIYVFSYKTNIFSRNYLLGDAVDALKEFMKLDGVFDCQALVFIAHSMGGLLARKLVVERMNDFKDKAISIGLFLVASPSLGSHYANLMSPLARLMGHTQADALRFSQDNAWLMDLDKEFTNLKEAETIQIFGKELVEDVFIVFNNWVSNRVVEPFSGARYFGEPFKVPNSDHFSIAKPDSAQAIQHRLLVNFLQEMPFPQPKKLPIEKELARQLKTRFEACGDAGVPFRTYHKLATLLAMQSRFAANCLDAAGPGTSASIDQWIRDAIVSQVETERRLGAPTDSLESDNLITAANVIAREEHASEIDERHLLMALLMDSASGTMREITDSLGKHNVALIQSAAENGRPKKIRLERSGVPPLRAESER